MAEATLFPRVTSPTLEDLGRRGRAFLVLAHMGRTDEAVTMTEFTRACRLVPEVARMLREELEGWGLVHSEVIGRRGVVELLSIRLTPLGRELARHVLAMDTMLTHAARRDAPRVSLHDEPSVGLYGRL